MKYAILFFPILVMGMLGCSEGNKGMNKSYVNGEAPAPPAVATDTVKPTADEGSAANLAALPPDERKMIKTGTLNCRVADVYQAADKLERLTKTLGGFVLESNMSSETVATEDVNASNDSIRKLETYQTTAHIVLRVPVANFDSLIAYVPQISVFVDLRNIRQDEATFQYIENQLYNNAADDQAAANIAMARAGKTRDVIAAQQFKNSETLTNGAHKLANMKIMDAVAFATITIKLSQPDKIFVQTVVDADGASRVPLAQSVTQALIGGWHFMCSCFLLLCNIWPAFIWAAFAALIVKIVLKRQARRNEKATAIV